VCFVIGKPLRRMWQMVEMSVGSASNVLPMSGGVWSKMMGRKKQTGPTPQDEFWDSVRDNDPEGDAAPQRGRGRVRPEASNPVMATAQRLDRDSQPGQIVSGSNGNGVRVGALPSGSGPAALPVARSRVVDSPTVTDRQWDRVDDAVLVPSRSGGGYSAPAQEPRRAETEVVAGRPVHVIYRPSRGFEVRDNS
jgi:hypothetical protein